MKNSIKELKAEMQAFTKAFRTDLEDIDTTMQTSFVQIEENVRSIRQSVHLIKQAGTAARRDLKRLNQIPIPHDVAIKELQEYLDKAKQ